MRKLVTIAVAVAVVIVLLGAYHHLRAHVNESVGSPIKGLRVAAMTAIPAHCLSRTYIDQAMSDVTVGSGFQPIDPPVTIVCRSAAGCTIGAESWAEVGGETLTGNQWGICTQLDGSIQGICTYQGYVPSDSSFVTGSFNNALPVAKGTHTVQAMLYTTSGAFLAQYNNTYHVYKP
jgi:hypothetical protein